MPLIQLDLFEDYLPQLSSGKTSQESLTQRTTPSDASWESLLEQTLPFHPEQADGRVQVSLPDQSAKSRGASLMLNISECPNDAVESSLSQVLETGGIDPAKILFERKSVCGDSSPSSDTGKDPAASVGCGSEGAVAGNERIAGSLTTDLDRGATLQQMATGAFAFHGGAVGCDTYNGAVTGDKAATLTAASGVANCSGPKVIDGACLGLDRASFNQGAGAKYDFQIMKDKQPTLTSRGPGAVLQTKP